MASILGLGSKEQKKPNPKEDDYVPLPEHKGRRLLVRIWSSPDESPHVLAKKQIKYGQPQVTMKIGGKDRLYKINYRTKGMIKQDGKRFYYDTDFLNQIGGLSFHEYPEDIDSEEAYTVFKNNGVDMYVKKGGISFKMFILVVAVALIAVVGLVITSMYTMSTMQTNSADEKQLVKLSTMIDQLRAQIQGIGAHPVV